jgi:hypothetical protein
MVQFEWGLTLSPISALLANVHSVTAAGEQGYASPGDPGVRSGRKSQPDILIKKCNVSIIEQHAAEKEVGGRSRENRAIPGSSCGEIDHDSYGPSTH